MNQRRFQLALNVKNLEESITYYSKLFNTNVNKRKPGYANFAIDNPPLKLVLMVAENASQHLNHLGVEVFEQEDVDEAITHFDNKGIRVDDVEKGSICCFAKQNKVWSADPEGIRWEWYRVLENSKTFGNTGHDTCEPTCCS